MKSPPHPRQVKALRSGWSDLQQALFKHSHSPSLFRGNTALRESAVEFRQYRSAGACSDH